MTLCHILYMAKVLGKIHTFLSIYFCISSLEFLLPHNFEENTKKQSHSKILFISEKQSFFSHRNHSEINLRIARIVFNSNMVNFIATGHWHNGSSVRQWTGRPGFNPGWVIPKTLKMVLDASLLNTQHYKVRIKGKVEKSWERSSALPNTLV